MIYNRAEAVDQNFRAYVEKNKLPPARSTTSLEEAGLTPADFKDLFESQMMSRHLDIMARILKNEGQCFYTIGSSGHEGNAVLGKTFKFTDMAFLHYRSCALMIQRAKQVPEINILRDLMLSFTASSEDPIARGRHKVFGSRPLNIPPQTSTIASHLPKAVGAALSIGKARDLNLTTELPPDAMILCNFGDASANHSTALGAFNTARLVSYQNVKLPLVFACEDNGIGISVKTPQSWIEDTFSNQVGMKYFKADGLSLPDLYKVSLEVERYVRLRRKPVFFHIKMVRLLGHAGSDVETTYRKLRDIENTEFNDPLLHSARIALEEQIMSEKEILELYEGVRERVSAAAEYAIGRPKLTEPEQIKESVALCREPRPIPPPANQGRRELCFGKEMAKMKAPTHMAKLLNWGLTDILLQYPNAVLFGEDVAQKGGVYHVTDNLIERFGARRVFNSPLDETSIIGTAIGLAHNGFLPIPEIQFLAYVHNAEDQIRGEAATLPFFSDGQYTNSMLLRIAGLAYQKGFGGHFHNDNSLAVFRDIPGLVIAVPSNGADAVRMLRSCAREAWQNGRVVVFIEPIALYMTKDLHEEGDKLWSFEYPNPEEEIELGEFGISREGDDISLITYGNGTYYALQAARVLQEKHQISTQVIDLRWLAPIDWPRLIETCSKTNHLVIVDECRKTGSLSEAIVTAFVEHSQDNLPKMTLVTADDCFIPLGVAAAAGLPKRDEIVRAILQDYKK